MDSSPADALRILVIDDNETTRETFQYMLAVHGYTALSAPTVKDGLNSIDAQLPDAVLLDFHMPVADGLQCVRTLRSSGQTSRNVPVAIITGDYFMEECVATELNQLGTRIYFKPIWEDDIVRIVRELLGPKSAEGPDGYASQ